MWYLVVKAVKVKIHRKYGEKENYVDLKTNQK